MVTYIIPCRNAAPNAKQLIGSLLEQNDSDWNAIVIDDVSDDGTFEAFEGVDERISVVRNGVRKYALRNIVEASRGVVGVVAIIDGDDQLCNPETTSLLKHAHTLPLTVAWTAHRWDINGMNISKPMPEHVNPYQYQWCSSHLKTFDAELIRNVSENNFQDHLGEWFKRGYDQALMLPLLYRAKHRVYIQDVCYLYKINSCSVQDRDWAERAQLQTVNFIRARGYLTNG